MKFGLIGYGFMGAAHLAAMQRIHGVEVKAVSSRRRPSADSPRRGNLDLAAGTLPETVSWSPDWHALVADPEIQAVDICLPTNMHFEVIMAALSVGKHVLCEKPMALTFSECEQLMDAAEKSDRIFMVGQVLRFMYPYRYAARFISETGSQAVTRCILRRSTGYPQWGGWLSQEKLSGGAILDLLSHDVDQALHFFGQPKSVSTASMGPVDTLKGILHYESGLNVTIEGGWLAPNAAFSASFEINTPDKQLVYRDNRMTETVSGVETVVEIPEQDPYLEEIAYFTECCRNNAPPSECLPLESAQAVKLSLLLKRSREAGGQEQAWQN
jgi:predicted dehydrogenase